MRIVIVGAGAMGSLIGGLLAESGAQTILYDISLTQVEAIRRNGLIIEKDGKKRSIPVRITDRADELGTAGLLLVLVKAYDTREAIFAVRNSVGPKTIVLTLQNGIGNVEAIADVIPLSQISAGVTSHGAMLVQPGVVRHSGGASTFVGSMTPEGNEGAEEAARILTAAGVETAVSTDIAGAVWTKLLVNAAINPLTALTGLFNGELLDDSGLLEIMTHVIREAEGVANALGIQLQPRDMVSYVHSICRATAGNKSSMLMDIIRGRRTEITAINGIIARKAREFQLPATVNETLTALVIALEKESKIRKQ